MPATVPARPDPCRPDVGGDGWQVVARSLDDRAGTANAPSDAEVRSAVVTIAASLRAEGLGPERALVLVKGLAHCTLDARHRPLTPEDCAARIARIVGWTIEGYYADA
jgi:hypothetical protein